MMSSTRRSRPSSCAACSFTHRWCPAWCVYAEIFPNVINRRDYHTIFTVFGIKNVATVLRNLPDHQHLETLQSFLFEAKVRIDNPTGGCTDLIVSLGQKIEELQLRVMSLEALQSRVMALEALQSRVMALEARLDSESSRANPSSSFTPPVSSFALSGGSPIFFAPPRGSSTPPGCSSFAFAHPESSSRAHPSSSFAYPSGSFAPPESSSRLLSSAEKITPNIIQTAENPLEPGVLPIQEDLLQHPYYGSFLNLLNSTPDIRQAALIPFPSQSSQGGAVAEVAEPTSPDWAALGDLERNVSNNPSFNFDPVLNSGADDLQILPPFWNN